MGFFTDVHATLDQQGGQAILTYQVKERPLITDVSTEGMKEIKPTDDKIVGAIKLHPGVDRGSATRASEHPGDAAGLPGQGLSRCRHHVPHDAGPNNTAVGVFHVNEGPLVEISEHQVHRQQGVLSAPAERADGDRASTIC